jgi:hypothetical protein
MNKSYAEDIHLGFYMCTLYCYAYVDNTDGNACVVYFLFQLGAFRIQNLQRTRVCIPLRITSFQSLCLESGLFSGFVMSATIPEHPIKDMLYNKHCVKYDTRFQ